MDIVRKAYRNLNHKSSSRLLAESMEIPYMEEALLRKNQIRQDFRFSDSKQLIVSLLKPIRSSCSKMSKQIFLMSMISKMMTMQILQLNTTYLPLSSKILNQPHSLLIQTATQFQSDLKIQQCNSKPPDNISKGPIPKNLLMISTDLQPLIYNPKIILSQSS